MNHSEQFLKWFDRSKVICAAGKPLRAYHGTIFDVVDFRTKGNIGQGEDFPLDGAFFSDSPEAADEFGGDALGVRIIPVFLSLQNPLEQVLFDDGEGVECDWRNPISEQAIILSARDAGHDGVILKSSLTGERYFVVFNSDNICSIFSAFI